MKKILLMFLSVLLFCGCTFHKKITYNKNIEILPTFESTSNAQNKAWIGTFQLVFNDMKNEVIKKDIYFVNEKPSKNLISLNQETFTKDMLNESTYYKSYGETSPEAKNMIIKEIKKKFNETSDILDKVDWTKEEGKYYAYAMLKKEFDFIKPFDKLEQLSFNNSEKKYDYFGINKDSKEELLKNVNVLFYNNENDYAIQLLTKNNDTLLLYRNDKNKTFDKMYQDMMKKMEKFEGNRKLTELDTVSIPNIKMNEMRSFDELCNKRIQGTNKFFSSAIETLQFELDEKGGKVKSEAIIMAENCAMMPMTKELPRDFKFDKPFTIFLADVGQESPYMAIRIEDLDAFVESK